jgi:hypothetical protein
VNNFDIWSDYGRASWDVPHRFVVSGIYELPFFREARSAWVRGLAGGWQVSGVATFQSGTPINVVIQGDRANVGSPNQRPDVLKDVELSCRPNPAGPGMVDCIDPTAFAIPAQYTFGNAPRNMLRGPGYSRTDLSIMKAFAFGSRCRLTIQGQVLNVFNEVNWGAPNATLGAANFGRITSALDMRTAELGVRFSF